MTATFTTTVVGSFSRPLELIEATKKHAKGEFPQGDLDTLLEKATESTIKAEEEAGLDVITDGEQRRSSFVGFVGDKIPGFEVMHITHLNPDAMEILKRNRVQLTYARAVVSERLRESVIARDEFEKARKYSKKPFKVTLPAPYLVMWECFKGDLLIIGDNKQIRDVSAGDLCVGTNGLQTIKGRTERYFDGSLIEFRAAGMLPVECTPEHPILVSERIRAKKGKTQRIALGKPYWKSAKDIHPGRDYVVIPKLKGKMHTTTLDLQQFFSKRFRPPYRNGLVPSISFTQDVAWLFGLYVAEGCAERSRVDFALHQKEVETAERIRRLATTLGLRSVISHENASRKRIVVGVYGAVFARALRTWFGSGSASEKHLPDFLLFETDKAIVRSFWDGYFDGDGHGSKSTKGLVEAKTTSQLLALQLQLISARLGGFARIYSSDSNKSEHRTEGRVIQPRRHYLVRYYDRRVWHDRIGEDESHFYSMVQKVGTNPYHGPVYNMGTEDQTYLAQNIVVHNCWHKTLSKDAYPNPEDFGYAFAKILHDEVLRLKEAGVSFIQLDEPMLGDLTEAGDKPDRYRRVFYELYGQEYRGFREELRLAVDLLNEVTRGVTGVRMGVHMDRWPNKDSPYFDQGYERFLPELLETKTDQFVLEYVSPGTGDPAKLVEQFPKELEIGLGVVSVQNYEVETPEQIVRRAKRVIGHIDPERIWLNPDCGFAPGMYRTFPREVAFAKLRSMTKAAEILRREYA